MRCPLRVPALLTVLLTVAALPAAASPASAGAGQPTVPEQVPGELLVTWEPSADARERAHERARADLEILDRSPLTGVERVAVAADEDPAAVAAELRRRGVADAQPNYVYRSTATTDPHWSSLWGLDNTGQAIDGQAGTPDVDLDVPEAWATTTGAPSVVVAVIDTGVDITHPDLAGNIWVNLDEQAGVVGVDDDGNGYVDDLHGWDVVNGDATVYDAAAADAHGTHVAGTIAATADNGRGVAGVAPNVTILPLKFIGPDGAGSTADAIAAIEYATAQGVDVINASWGGAAGSASDNALNDAIAASGAVFVAAAGNGGSDGTGDDSDTTAVSPAGLPAANIVAVAAVDNTGSLASFSNYGATTVDVAAPGVDIVSTLPEDRYAWMSGTSMAAPHVAGVAALVAAQGPARSATGIVDVLLRPGAVQPLTSLESRTVTGGMSNARGALDVLATIDQGPVWPSDAAVVADMITTDGFTIRWPEASDDVAVTDHLVTVGDAAPVAVSGTTYQASGLAAGTTYPVVVVARDGADNHSTGLITEVTTVAEPASTPDSGGTGGGTSGGTSGGGSGGGGGGGGGGGSAPAPSEPAPAPAPAPTEPAPEPSPEQAAPYDGDGARTLERACPAPPSSGYTDVPTGYTHRTGIDCASAWNVFVGGAGGAFGPDQRLSRGQLASVLARALERALGEHLPTAGDHFPDDDSSVHRDAIDALAGLGIVGGFEAGRYAPDAPVTRAQFAAMLGRTYGHLVGSLPAGPDAFRDDDRSPHEATIDGLAALGIVVGDGRGYQPGAILTRAQAATMVARLLDALVEAGAAEAPTA